MKTIRTEYIEPVYVETIPDKMEQGKIYISKKYQTSIHLCLCGCGEQTVLPLDSSMWILDDSNGKVTLMPSILQRGGCKSHYIITNGRANFV